MWDIVTKIKTHYSKNMSTKGSTSFQEGVLENSILTQSIFIHLRRWSLISRDMTKETCTIQHGCTIIAHNYTELLIQQFPVWCSIYRNIDVFLNLKFYYWLQTIVSSSTASETHASHAEEKDVTDWRKSQKFNWSLLLIISMANIDCHNQWYNLHFH